MQVHVCNYNDIVYVCMLACIRVGANKVHVGIWTKCTGRRYSRLGRKVLHAGRYVNSKNRYEPLHVDSNIYVCMNLFITNLSLHGQQGLPEHLSLTLFCLPSAPSGHQQLAY